MEILVYFIFNTIKWDRSTWPARRKVDRSPSQSAWKLSVNQPLFQALVKPFIRVQYWCSSNWIAWYLVSQSHLKRWPCIIYRYLEWSLHSKPDCSALKWSDYFTKKVRTFHDSLSHKQKQGHYLCVYLFQSFKPKKPKKRALHRLLHWNCEAICL